MTRRRIALVSVINTAVAPEISKLNQTTRKQKSRRIFRETNSAMGKLHRSRLQLALLGIMGPQLRAPLKPLDHHSNVVLRGLRDSPRLGPHDAERHQLCRADDGNVPSLCRVTVPLMSEVSS